MSVAVDIFVKDDSVSPAPIAGVVVGVLDAVTLVPVAMATTDGAGRAAFLLPGAVTPGLAYEVRLFKLGVRFANPVAIQVVEPVVTTNKFDMSGTLLALSAATDPRLCRCSGRFMSFSNTPIVGATLRFMAMAESGFQTPKIVDGNIISAESLATQTDADGFAVVDLLRTGRYYVTFSGEDDTTWNILVPDRASVNLIELIHPQPVLLKWDATAAPLNAVSVQVGATVLVPYTVVFSDFEELSTGLTQWIKFINSDDTKAAVGFSSGMLSVTGVAPGVVNVTTEMLPNLNPPRVPDYSITAPTLVVTVTP